MMLKKPVVYLAGKIAPHDWRERLIGKEVALYTGDERKLFDPLYTVERPTFIYGGPFYVACDHRCGHGPASHGVGASGEAGCFTEWFGNTHSTPRRVFDVNRRRLANASHVFVFIDRLDCYGTLIELGMAVELGKRITIVFGENISRAAMRELWMARMCTDPSLYAAWSLDAAWRSFLRAPRSCHVSLLPRGSPLPHFEAQQ